MKKSQRPKRKGSSHPRPRRRPRPRPGTVTVYQIHCKACKRRYELAGFAEVNFCTFCQSDQIEKAIRNRKETPEERKERERQQTAFLLNAAGRILGGIFGFHVPNGIPQQPAPTSDLEREVLKEGYRKLATKYHPDHGGDAEKMKELNRLKDKFGL